MEQKTTLKDERRLLMFQGNSHVKKVRNVIIKAFLACGIALFPTHGFAVSDRAEINTESNQLTYENRDTYIRAEANEEVVTFDNPSALFSAFAWLTGAQADALPDSGHTLYVKNTLADINAAQGKATFNNIYASNNWMDIIAGQYNTTLDLLDPGKDAQYFVALAAPTAFNKVGKAVDYVFADCSNDGNVIQGAFYDKETSIAYVPKKLYYKDNAEIAFACQLQLLIPTEISENASCITDVIITNNDWRLNTTPIQNISSSVFDVTTTLPITTPEDAGKIGLSDLHVRINNSTEELALRENENAYWDSTRGTLELYMSPQTLLQVEVTINAPNILKLFSEPAHATATSSLAYVPNVVFDSLNVSTLIPGRSMDFTSEINYWWPNPHPNDKNWQACIATGSYCYSWLNDPNGLYEYIAWADGANWNGVNSKNVSNFNVSPTGTQASRNYFNYTFEFGNWQIEDQNFHSNSWPITQPNCYGANWATFGLQCSHIANPVGGKVYDDGIGHMRLRILDVNTDAARPYIVLGFVGPSVANQPGVGMYKFEIQIDGDIAITFKSLNPSLSNNNTSYFTAGIMYDVYSDASCMNYITTITLDSEGNGKSARLKKGTYYVRLNEGSIASHGFATNGEVYAAEVNPGTTYGVEVACEPQSYNADVVVNLVDSITSNATPQGDATLENAIFEIRHYRDQIPESDSSRAFKSRITKTPQTVSLPTTTPLKSWRLKSDREGSVAIDDAHFISGDSFYLNSSNAACLPLGTLVIEEVSPSNGYRASTSPIGIALPSLGLEENLIFTKTLAMEKEVEAGDIGIEKLDVESMLKSPLGAASLEGTTFAITNKSKESVCVDGVFFAQDEVIMNIAVSEGTARTYNFALPYGTYDIQEQTAGTGYLASDTQRRTCSVRTDQSYQKLSGNNSAANQVKRGDIDFIKVFASDQRRLSRIPFVLESQTTGERHVVVTDENGIMNTHAQWRAHTSNTNVNDTYLSVDENAVINADLLDTTSGTWFGLTESGTITRPDNTLGALPFDTYRLKELRASTNLGLELVTIENITIAAHALTVALGNIENRIIPPPAITTQASNADDGSKTVFPKNTVRIVDVVEYCNLEVGAHYKVNGKLYNASTQNPLTEANDKPVESAVEFSPTSSSGCVEVIFEFDASKFGGVRAVCFEEIRRISDSEIIATHNDFNDYAQSVDIVQPKINTYATNATSGTKEALPNTAFTLEDSVSYHGLEPGVEYKLVGSLMKKVKDSGEVRAVPALSDDNSPLTCTIDFIPEDTSGNTLVTFNVDASAAQESTDYVVFETLYKDEIPVVVHENPSNDAQTVMVRKPKSAVGESIQENPTPLSSAKRGMPLLRGLPKTGDALAIIQPMLLLLVGVTFLGIALRKLKGLGSPLRHFLLRPEKKKESIDECN